MNDLLDRLTARIDALEKQASEQAKINAAAGEATDALAAEKWKLEERIARLEALLVAAGLATDGEMKAP